MRAKPRPKAAPNPKTLQFDAARVLGPARALFARASGAHTFRFFGRGIFGPKNRLLEPFPPEDLVKTPSKMGRRKGRQSAQRLQNETRRSIGPRPAPPSTPPDPSAPGQRLRPVSRGSIFVCPEHLARNRRFAAPNFFPIFRPAARVSGPSRRPPEALHLFLFIFADWPGACAHGRKGGPTVFEAPPCGGAPVYKSKHGPKGSAEGTRHRLDW